MITKLNFTDRTIKSYAIRKLTPKECFRLMGVRDNVIGTMQSSNAQAAERVPDWKGKGKPEDMAVSASQQYKQAGNSIVVDVLARIYEQLFYPTPKSRKQEQLSLFDDLEDSLPAMPPTAANAVEEKIFLTTFSGYDSQLMAADVLKEWHPDFRWTCKGWSDIDKYACQMHNLVFPQFADCALGDITKIDWHAVKRSLQGREVDLFTYSSPCQDISQVGKQMGLQEGSDTRSALLWRVADAVEVLRPKYLLQENVAALVSQKFMPDFQKWLDKLSSLGYVSRWARLNAKNYGVPQNRDRVFCISMRQDVAFDYQFPEPFELRTRLEDVLEEEVADRYFLKDDAVSKFLKANDSDNALFLQFDLPPTHEAAMFLKTWLTLWMQATDGWKMTPTSLQLALYSAKQKMELSYSVFTDKGVVALCDEFQRLFKENMERKRDGV
ncbi:DNA (cytosine-5-)-methyltransferase [uncultured Prevotella sp.]|uniref:DNA cytosine methyltransferase n=1 Tax=uncultured Prevotella sp. TaxID=159272 RepID=UPI0027E39148|nr:DNA (cytosine-5-)-methyltransferase [uncultured Prevotella sp.]